MGAPPGAHRRRSAPPEKRDVRREMDPMFLPQEVDYDGPHKPGTIVIDTPAELPVPGRGKAARRGATASAPASRASNGPAPTRSPARPNGRTGAAGRDDRARARQGPHLPAFMPGGPENPLGARALYIGSTLYRIHGTNQPWTIGGGLVRLHPHAQRGRGRPLRAGNVGAKVIVM